MLSFFPRGVLDEILNLIESVSEDFPSYSWQELRQWLSTVSNLVMILEEKSVLFSYYGRQQLLNYILTVAKQYLYKTKFFADELNLNAFISILKDKF